MEPECTSEIFICLLINCAKRIKCFESPEIPGNEFRFTRKIVITMVAADPREQVYIGVISIDSEPWLNYQFHEDLLSVFQFRRARFCFGVICMINRLTGNV